MYSGSTLTKMSGRVLGGHQKIDRVARRNLTRLVGSQDGFPDSRLILHFEGKNGPDGIKRKSPSQDEEWHFYSPFNDDDSELLTLIHDHYGLLVKELKDGNEERAAFEAAWLAHALVDGLTPAHHYPYEEKLTELRGGAGNETRTNLKDKLIIPGATAGERVKNNWKMWGPKGLFTTHGLFEVGFSTIIAPLSFAGSMPTDEEVKRFLDIGILEWFKRAAREVAALNMYERYYRRGWTTKLALDARQKLAPAMIETVTLSWYAALVDAGLIKHTA